MVAGSQRTSWGKIMIRIVVMTIAIINTLVPVKTFIRSTFAEALTTKATTPTGGKTSPMHTIMIDMTPNQMGSNPRCVISGKVSCRVRRRSGISSMNMLMTK